MTKSLHDELLARWRKLWDDRGTPRTPDIDAAFERLWLLYSDPERGYHNIEHIKFCLDEFDTVQRLSRHRFALEAAIWWHDVIYDPRRPDNEEKSMRFATNEMLLLGESPHFIARVSGIIMATIHAGGVIDPDQQLMCDIDLASLGTPDFEIMCSNSRGIRKEYAHVPHDVYVQRRGEILSGFADRESLYYTPHFRGLYTERAKSNIRREIAILPELAKL